MFAKLYQKTFTSKIRAIHEDDLFPMLKKNGTLEKIYRGELRCKYTNEVITTDNLEGIIPTKNGYEFICTKALIIA